VPVQASAENLFRRRNPDADRRLGEAADPGPRHQALRRLRLGIVERAGKPRGHAGLRRRALAPAQRPLTSQRFPARCQSSDRIAPSLTPTRRILCVFPRYARSFGTLHHAYPMMPRVKAFMPPQGLLLIAATLPKEWEVRFVDENMAPATARDFAWADAVFVSGMHVQRNTILDVN